METTPLARQDLPRPKRELRRFDSNFEIRRDDAGKPTVVGYAAVFEQPYTITDMLGDYTEEVAQGAFTKTISEGDDVRYFYNHDGLVLARTRSGTLNLSQDEHGLHYEAELEPRQQAANDLTLAIDRGDVSQSSFAFKATRQEWDEDYTHRRLVEVKLYDVSSVAFPANEATTSGLRADELIAELAQTERELLVAQARNETHILATYRALTDMLTGIIDEIEKPSDTPSMIPTALRQRELATLKTRRA